MDKPVFSPTFIEELAEACPHGPCSVDLVQSWFAIVWPQMRARGYRNWKLATTKWWARVYQSELDRAQERLDKIEAAAEEARLDALADEANKEKPPEVDVERRLWVVR